jgi:hypothetical protein
MKNVHMYMGMRVQLSATVNTKNWVKFSADGSTIASVAALPIAPNKAQLVYNAEASAAGKAWIWDVAIDKV